MGRKKRSRRDAAARGRKADEARSRPAGGAAGRRKARTAALAVTAAVIVAGIAAAVAVAVRSGAPAAQDPGPPPGAAEAVARAADAVSFRPNAGTSDLIERLPADAPLVPSSPTLLAVGAQAPEFELWTPTAERVRLADYRGKTVLLEFFATWCPHCQAEARHLVELHSKLPADQFAFVAVNVDSEDAATVLAYDRFYGIPYPTALDPGGLQGDSRRESGPGKVSRQYKVASYPTFYVIDPEGRIRWRADREQPDALLMQELTRASNP